MSKKSKPYRSGVKPGGKPSRHGRGGEASGRKGSTEADLRTSTTPSHIDNVPLDNVPQVDGREDSRPERIAKLLARAGVASRREAERMVMAGRVRLNGQVLDTPAVTATLSDRIEVDGAVIEGIERTRLWLYHKPSGLVTTNRDPEGRPTVFEHLPEHLPRVLSVGRLDINTEGLLLLTNDGGLASLLELPSTGWLRRYRVRAHGNVSQERLDRLREGIAVDGMLYGSIEAVLDRKQGSNVWMTMAFREGKNREIKNVLGAIGLEVNRLIRISYGPFQLGDLAEGAVQEVRGRTLRDQLGPRLIRDSGANFEAPIRSPRETAKISGRANSRSASYRVHAPAEDDSQAGQDDDGGAWIGPDPFAEKKTAGHDEARSKSRSDQASEARENPRAERHGSSRKRDDHRKSEGPARHDTRPGRKHERDGTGKRAEAPRQTPQGQHSRTSHAWRSPESRDGGDGDVDAAQPGKKRTFRAATGRRGPAGSAASSLADPNRRVSSGSGPRKQDRMKNAAGTKGSARAARVAAKPVAGKGKAVDRPAGGDKRPTTAKSPAGHKGTDHQRTGHEVTGHKHTGHKHTDHKRTGYKGRGNADRRR